MIDVEFGTLGNQIKGIKLSLIYSICPILRLNLRFVSGLIMLRDLFYN